MSDLATWLSGLGLEKYAEVFAAHEVDLAALGHLTDGDLKELGLPLGPRRKILAAFGRSNAGAAPAAPAPPEPIEADRRQVTVVFADLVGYTALSRRLDAEELHRVLEAFFARVDRIVEDHGGRVDKHIGDCVMAVFGAPVAHGNDVERAVAAALSIREAVPRLGGSLPTPLVVHIGVASGQVVASGIGTSSHREYTVTGESVNLAARLTDAAGPGEVLVSERVQRDLAGRIESADAGLFSVEGFADPVRAYRVAGLRAPAPARPLVGRHIELAQFRSILAACRETGRGRAVQLRGEAGIGKTRLVEEVRAIAGSHGFACHTGLVLDFGAGMGRDAIRALVRSLLGLAQAGTPEALKSGADAAIADGLAAPGHSVFLYDLLGLPHPPDLRALYDAMDNQTRNAGRRAALMGLVERLSRREPRVLIVEDLHWADAATLSCLADLAAAVATCPAILIMTSRIEQDPLDQGWRAAAGGSFLSIDLGPLLADEAGELAAPFLASNAALARRCVERAGGNPLFLEQLLRNAVEGETSNVPGSVQSLVQARLDRLAHADRAALQAASVLGQRFDREALAALLDQPGYPAERFIQHLMVRPQGEEFLFAHALIHEAVYDSLLKSRRSELHRRAAAFFAARDPSLKAAHLDRAGDAQAPRAYLEAARRQAGEYRYEAARGLARRGLELASEHADRFALADHLGEVLHDIGDMPGALAAYRDALAMAGSGPERCHALIGCAAVKRVTDDLDGAFGDLADAEVIAVADGLKREEARIRFLRGNLYFPRGNIEGCLNEHARGLELAREAGSAEQEAAALGGLGDAEYMRGRMMIAHQRFQKCVELCQEHGLARIEVANRPMMAFTGLFTGPAHLAAAASATAIDRAKRVGHRRAEIVGQHAASFTHHAMLNVEAAEEHADAALRISRELGSRRFEVEGLALRAAALHLKGLRSEAIVDAEAAVALAFETGPAFLGPYALGVLALVTTDPRRRREALSEAERVLRDGAVSHNHLLFRRDAIEVSIETGNWDSAERFASELEAYTRPEPLPWSDFYIARARALAKAARSGARADALAGLERVRSEAMRLGCLHALPAIELAMGAG